MTHEGTAGDDTITAGDNQDILAGRGGDDVLNGDDGLDTYLYASGDGNDTIIENYRKERGIIFLTDLTASDIVISHIGNDMVITDLSTMMTITAVNHFYGSGFRRGIERIDFGDDTSYSRTDIVNNLTTLGTSASETVNGSDHAETLIGGLGDDVINGDDGFDTYIYASGDGNDTINEGYGQERGQLILTDLNSSDVVLTHSGNNLLVTDTTTGQVITVINHYYATGRGLTNIDFADGTSYGLTDIINNLQTLGTSAGETINGSSNAEIIVGGLGDDTISGAAGLDTYIYASGDGNDVINEGYDEDMGILQLTDIVSAGVELTRTGNDLVVTDVATGQT